MNEENFLKEIEKELEKKKYDYTFDIDNDKIILYLVLKYFRNEYIIGIEILEYLFNKGFIFMNLDVKNHIIIFVKEGDEK